MIDLNGVHKRFIDVMNKEYDDFLAELFLGLGYSREWILNNANRIKVEYSFCNNKRTYYLDGEELFSVSIDIDTNFNLYYSASRSIERPYMVN